MSIPGALIRTSVNVLGKVVKKVAKYGTAGLAGYEVGEVFHDDSGTVILPKETPSPPMFEIQTSGLEQYISDIKILLMVIIVAILIVVLLLLGYKSYSFIGKRATEKFKKSLEKGV